MATSETMEFSVEAAGPCRKRVKVNIPTELVTMEFEKSYKQWIKTVPMRGFRQGKAPRSLVEKRFGPDIALEVKKTLIDSAFDEALKENNLAPIADPELDLESVTVEPRKPVAFDFVVTVKPEFELPELKELSVEVPVVGIDEDDVDDALKQLRKRKATFRPLDAKNKIENDDLATLKVRGKIGDTEHFSNDNMPYEVGSNRLVDLITEGMDKELLGAKAGKSFGTTGFVPAHNANHPLAGMELDLDVELIEAKRPELPEVDEEFAKAFDFDSKDELVGAIRKDLENRLESDREKFIESAALAKLVDETEIDLPDDLIEREVEDMARRAAYEMQMQGKSEEEIAQKIVEIRSRRAEESTRELKAYFLLDKIVEKERIIVTEGEVRDAVAQIAAYQGQTVDQMYALLRDSGRLGGLRNQLREKKARAKLRKKVQVTDAPADASGKAKKADKKPADAEKPAKKTAAKKKTTKKKKS